MLRHVAKTAEGELQAIDAKIRDAIGSHAAAMLDDGTLYTLTTQRRKETVVKASESRVLRRKEARR
jgi:hypothetical protein